MGCIVTNLPCLEWKSLPFKCLDAQPQVTERVTHPLQLTCMGKAAAWRWKPYIHSEKFIDCFQQVFHYYSVYSAGAKKFKCSLCSLLLLYNINCYTLSLFVKIIEQLAT